MMRSPFGPRPEHVRMRARKEIRVDFRITGVRLEVSWLELSRIVVLEIGNIYLSRLIHFLNPDLITRRGWASRVWTQTVRKDPDCHRFILGPWFELLRTRQPRSSFCCTTELREQL